MGALRTTKRSTKIIKFLLAGIVGLGALFVPLKDTVHHTVSSPIVYAATGDVAKLTDAQKAFADTLEIVLKIIYLLLWPFLALAGLALDNGMVYGSYFQLDSALFTFWNIVKNFANFALGFLFLRSILKYIFNFGSKAENPMGMITKLLIAGIGIQASWFVMGALIDLSTVATVGVGGLPLKLLSEETVGKKPLFGVKTNLKISDIGDALTTDKGFVILYTYPTKKDEYYLPCVVVDEELLDGEKRATAFGVTDTSKKIGSSDATWDQINKDFCIFGNDVLSLSKASGKKIQPGSPELKTMLKESQTDFRGYHGCDTAGGESLCQTISNIAQKGKGYQGAFYSLYGSLLNLGSIHVSVHKSTGSMTMEALIKALIGIAYLVPLLVLCVVLIIRIAVLRVTIAFSPVLVLAEVFKFKLGDMEKFGIKNALSMIFLPVMATFAISISIVFLAVLSEGLTKGDGLKDIGMNTSHEGGKTCLNLVITTLCIDTPSQDIGVSGMLDFFPWIILNIFGIGLMWTILMTTLKSTKFTEKIVNGIDTFAKNMVSTANIVPLPGGATSVAALRNTARSISGEIDQAAANNARTVVAPSIENFFQGNFSGQVGKGQKQMETATQRINSTSSAKSEVNNLLASGNALYNGKGSGGFLNLNNKSNQLDLSQYGAAGLGLINKIADTAPASFKTKKNYDSVDEAFSDENFLKYLADPTQGLGMKSEDIRSLYSGREGTNNRRQVEIFAKIDAAAAAFTTPASGTQSSNTYTTPEGTLYTLNKEGFTEKKKGDTNTSYLNTKKDWDNLVDNKTLDIVTIEKMQSDGKVTLDKPFEDWMKAKKTPTPAPAPATPPPTTTTTTTQTQNQTPPTNNAATTNTTTTTTPPPSSTTP